MQGNVSGVSGVSDCYSDMADMAATEWDGLDPDDSWRTMNESDFLDEARLVTSTPAKKAKTSKKSSQPAQAPPQVPPAQVAGTSEQPFFVCKECGKIYKRECYLKKHMEMHKLEHYLLPLPCKKDVICESVSLAKDVVKKISENDLCVVGELGLSVKQYASAIFVNKLQGDEWKNFVSVLATMLLKFLKEEKAAMPTSLVTAINRGMQHILSNPDIRNKLRTCMVSVHHAEDEVINMIVMEVIMGLADALAVFILRSMRGTPDLHHILVNFQNSNDLQGKQAVHYVAGGVMHRFTTEASAKPNDKQIQKLNEIIVQRFLEDGKFATPVREEIRAWTKMQDRGALLFIGNEIFFFFWQLELLLGSLHLAYMKEVHSNVFQSVLQSLPLRNAWDKTISNSLGEQESIEFMRRVTRAFTSTHLRGTMKSLENLYKIPKPSVALRPGLAKLA